MARLEGTTMTADEVVARFELRSRILTQQAWVFLFGVLVLLVAGALAVVYAQNLTASDIGAPTMDEKLAATKKEQDRIKTRIKQIEDGPQKQCEAAMSAALAKWGAERTEVAKSESMGPQLTGDDIIANVEGAFSDVNDSKAIIGFRVILSPCLIYQHPDAYRFYLSKSDLAEFKSTLAGKVFITPEARDAMEKEITTLNERSSLMDRINEQINAEKIETEVGVLKPDATPKGENDLFLKLLQTSVTRFGLLAVIGFFVSILVSLYRYNIRLAGFYVARADALRLLGPEITVSDFALVVTALSPTVEFGKAPQPPVGQLIDLLKTAKETAK
jgi:hypothetical protein